MTKGLPGGPPRKRHTDAPGVQKCAPSAALDLLQVGEEGAACPAAGKWRRCMHTEALIHWLGLLSP
jgi:hypothetical protein